MASMIVEKREKRTNISPCIQNSSTKLVISLTRIFSNAKYAAAAVVPTSDGSNSSTKLVISVIYVLTKDKYAVVIVSTVTGDQTKSFGV